MKIEINVISVGSPEKKYDKTMTRVGLAINDNGYVYYSYALGEVPLDCKKVSADLTVYKNELKISHIKPL